MSFENLELDKKLTENFTVGEFIVSQDHCQLVNQIKLELSLKPFHELELLRYKFYLLARLFLQPIREYYKEPIRITSGYRSEALNQALNGSSQSSDHLYLGESAAVDFTGNEIVAASHYLATFLRHSFGQMIYYPDRKFVHVSLPSQKHLGNALVKVDGKFHDYDLWMTKNVWNKK